MWERERHEHAHWGWKTQWRIKALKFSAVHGNVKAALLWGAVPKWNQWHWGIGFVLIKWMPPPHVNDRSTWSHWQHRRISISDSLLIELPPLKPDAELFSRVFHSECREIKCCTCLCTEYEHISASSMWPDKWLMHFWGLETFARWVVSLMPPRAERETESEVVRVAPLP